MPVVDPKVPFDDEDDQSDADHGKGLADVFRELDDDKAPRVSTFIGKQLSGRG